MADSKQLRIMQILTAHLRGITPSAGYDFDMSTSVFRGRAIYGEQDPVPMLSIIESLEPDNTPLPANEERTVRDETWILLVQGFLKASGENPTDEAYNLKASVEKRLAEIVAIDHYGQPIHSTLFHLGGLVTAMTIGPGIVSGPRPEIASGFTFFYLPVGVGIAVDVADPFTTESFDYTPSGVGSAGGTSDAEAS